ncbi:MAG: hypothetical protein JSU70_05140, partial [Phycisphaerales bacterium]
RYFLPVTYTVDNTVGGVVVRIKDCDWRTHDLDTIQVGYYHCSVLRDGNADTTLMRDTPRPAA